MSDQAGILPKWFSDGGIILEKEQLDHSYNFWTMPILIFSPVQIIMGHPLPIYNLTRKIRTFFLRQTTKGLMHTYLPRLLLDLWKLLKLQNLNYFINVEISLVVKMVFCYQNCSDLLWEKIVLVIEKNFWNLRLKAENLQNFWDH